MSIGNPTPDLPVEPVPPAAPDVPQDPIPTPLQDPEPGRRSPPAPDQPDVGDPLPEIDQPGPLPLQS